MRKDIKIKKEMNMTDERTKKDEKMEMLAEQKIEHIKNNKILDPDILNAEFFEKMENGDFDD